MQQNDSLAGGKEVAALCATLLARVFLIDQWQVRSKGNAFPLLFPLPSSLPFLHCLSHCLVHCLSHCLSHIIDTPSECHFTDTPASSLLIRLLEGEGVQQNDSLADG